MRTSLTRPIVLLLFITLLGFAVRVYRLSSVPAGFFCDEAATGYNAWLILTTGRDEYGRLFPAFFQSFGIWRGGLPFYAAVPSVALFGLTEFASRFPSVIVGTATIPLIYLFTALLFTESSGLAVALLLAISPWHIQFSRFAEANVYLPFFLLTAMYLFLLAVKRKNHRALIASAVCFGLTVYTYFPAYALVPAVIASLTVIYRKNLKQLGKTLPVAAITFFLILIPMIFAAFQGTLFARLAMVAGASANRPFPEVAAGTMRTYVDHFLPEFLFTAGDIGYRTHFITRYSVRGMGELYLFQLPLLLAGIFFLLKFFGKDHLPILVLLLLYPLGSTVAPFADGGGPFATRSILGVIPLQIISAVGLVYLLRLPGHSVARTAAGAATMIVIMLSFFQYLNAYFTAYNSYSSDFWGFQYGPREIMRYYLAVKDGYDELYLPPEFNGPDIFPKFYDPQGLCRGKCKVGDVTAYIPGLRQLFSIRAENIGKTPGFSIMKTIPYPDGSPAFYVGQLPQISK